VFSQPLSDRAGITAEVTGNYTLAIEGGVGNAAPATYSVRLVPTVVAAGSLTLGHTVDDSISLPSQSVAYAPGQEAIVSLLMQLHGADLLTGDIPPDAAELLCSIRTASSPAPCLWYVPCSPGSP
jgi:hypothetical protein